MLLSHRRRLFVTAGAGALALLDARPARAAVTKVGYLISRPLDPTGPFYTAFLAGMRDVGLVDGQTVEILVRSANDVPERLPALAADLVAHRASVICAPTMDCTKAAAAVTKTVPIVMAHGLDPVGQGLVRSLRRPGTNVTGTAWDQAPDITTKYLEFLTEAVPGLTRVGCLIDPRWPGIQRYREVFDRAATARRVAVNTIEVRSPEDIDTAVPALAAGGAQAVFVYGSNLTVFQHRRILDLLTRHALPDISTHRDAVRAGALMSYGADFAELFRRAGYFIDRILRGADPAEIPIEMPSKYDLVINVKRAKALGLALPVSLLARADEVVE